MRLIDADALGLEINRKAHENFPANMNLTLYASSLLAHAPTIDAVPVIRCKDCYLHGECMTEDAFHWSGIQNPYCAAGKKVGG